MTADEQARTYLETAQRLIRRLVVSEDTELAEKRITEVKAMTYWVLLSLGSVGTNSKPATEFMISALSAMYMMGREDARKPPVLPWVVAEGE